MVKITKPFFYFNEKTLKFQNLYGYKGTIIYSNLKGSMIKINDEISVFVPKDALTKVKGEKNEN